MHGMHRETANNGFHIFYEWNTTNFLQEHIVKFVQITEPDKDQEKMDR